MSDYPALENFLAAYFHQDWQAEHATPDAVVDYYRGAESPVQVAATHKELAHLLVEETDDDALGGVARRLGSEYDPTRDGGTWRGWLEGIRDRLDA